MTTDNQCQSLHCYKTFAVQDRIDLSQLLDESRIIDPSDIDLGQLLPSAEDYNTKQQFCNSSIRNTGGKHATVV